MSAHLPHLTHGGARPELVGGRSQICIWLVDDNVAFRNSCVELLEHAGGFLCAGQFDSAEELLAALQKDKAPDVILLDIGLPGMSGLEALPMIKRGSPTPAVIVCSSLMSPAQEHDARSSGAWGVYAKVELSKAIASIVYQAVQMKPRAERVTDYSGQPGL